MLGELRTVEGVDPDLEMGAITELTAEARGRGVWFASGNSGKIFSMMYSGIAQFNGDAEQNAQKLRKSGRCQSLIQVLHAL